MNIRYKIKTKDNKIIICNDEDSLRKTLPKLEDNVSKVETFTKWSKKKKTEVVNITFTKEQKRKYTEDAKKLGCSSLQELIRMLLMMHSEIGVIHRGDGITE